MANVIRRRIRRKFAATLAELQTPGALLPSQWALAEDVGALVMRKSDTLSYDLVTILSSQSLNNQDPGASGATQVGVSTIDSDLPAADLQTTLENFKAYVDSLPETVQDKLDNFFTDSPTIDMVYNDSGNNAHLDIIPQGVRDSLNSYFGNNPFPQYAGSAGTYILNQGSPSEQTADFSISGNGRVREFTIWGGLLTMTSSLEVKIYNTGGGAPTALENTHSAANIYLRIAGENKLTVTNTYNSFIRPLGINCNPLGSGAVGTDSNPGITLSGKLAIAHNELSQNNAMEVVVEGGHTGNGIYVHGGQAFAPGNGFFYFVAETRYGSSYTGGRFCVTQLSDGMTLNMGLGTFDTRGGAAYNSTGKTFDGVLSIGHTSSAPNLNAIHIITTPHNPGRAAIRVQGGTDLGPSTGFGDYRFLSFTTDHNAFTKFIVTQRHDPTPANARFYIGLNTDTPSGSNIVFDMKGGSMRMDLSQNIHFGSNSTIGADGLGNLTVRADVNMILDADLVDGAVKINYLCMSDTPRIHSTGTANGSSQPYIDSRTGGTKGLFVFTGGNNTGHTFNPSGTSPNGAVIFVVNATGSPKQITTAAGIVTVTANKGAIFTRYNSQWYHMDVNNVIND